MVYGRETDWKMGEPNEYIKHDLTKKQYSIWEQSDRTLG